MYVFIYLLIVTNIAFADMETNIYLFIYFLFLIFHYFIVADQGDKHVQGSFPHSLQDGV